MADQFSEAERSGAGGLADRHGIRVAAGIRKHDSERGVGALSLKAGWNTPLNVLNMSTHSTGTACLERIRS